MIRAYDQIYLEDISDNMGAMFHDAVFEFKVDGNEFLQRFVASGIAELIEEANPKYAVGMSGLELYYEVMERTRDPYSEDFVSEERTIAFFDRTSAYWVGWALAHYQWYSNCSFSHIAQAMTYDDLAAMYYPLHEADISKFYHAMDEILNKEGISKLKEMRERRGITQDELSRRSGISINTIRAYERKSKDINKAQYDILFALASALGCEPKDLAN